MFRSIKRGVKKLTEEAPQGDDKMIIKVKRLDSRYNWRGRQVVVNAGDVPEVQENEAYDEYGQFVLVHTRFFNRLGFLTSQSLDIKSLMLKKVLKELIGDDYPGISFKTSNIVLQYPLRVLWYYRPELREIYKEDKKSETGRHVKLLLDFLDTEFSKFDKDLKNLTDEGLIEFEQIWTLFKPGTLAYTTFDGHPRVFETKFYKEQLISCNYYGCITGNYVDYDGDMFGYAEKVVLNPSFEGAMKIIDLPVFPLSYHPREKEARLDLISRGRKFESLRGIHCMEYSGLTISKPGYWGSKLHVNGRVMVDVKTHKHYHPDKAIAVKSLNDDDDQNNANNAQQQRGGYQDGSDWYDEDGRRIGQAGPQPNLNVNLSKDGTGQDLRKKNGDKEEESHTPLTEDQHLLCSSTIHGFALNEKQWVEFYVEHLQPVRWNVKSFDQLVLPPSQKKLVKTLVEGHLTSKSNFDDFIAGKGKGLICCLHGSPGSGKTMTAESVADFTRSPLYCISAGDLGHDPAEMEQALSKILRLCTIWNAVLLLDEADVFLEERSLHDLKRNALVSIFLRILEYYSGILFLTTNRVKTFDEAFQSRIHVALHYRDLDKAGREQVWRNFVQKMNDNGSMTDIQESDYDFLGSVPLNGRQIKNAARTALSIAENDLQPLSVEHVQSVLGIVQAFEKDFKEVRNKQKIGV